MPAWDSRQAQLSPVLPKGVQGGFSRGAKTEKIEDAGHRTVHVMEGIDEKDHKRHRDRDRHLQPLNPGDSRVLAYETARPDVFTCSSFEELLADPVVPSSISQELASMPPAGQEWLLRCLKSRNSNTVETSPVLSALIGSNTCCYPLGTAEQAKACVWYLLNYIVKDPVELQAAVLLIQKTRSNAAKYGSSADDAGTLQRDSQFLAMKLVNAFTGAKEIPAVLASMICFGRRRYVSNHSYRFLNVTGAVRYVQDKYMNDPDAYKRRNADEAIEEEEEGPDSDGESDEEEEDDVVPMAAEDEVEILPSKAPNEQYGTAIVFDVNGEKEVVYPVEVYENRPLEGTRSLNMYEMSAISTVKRVGGCDGDDSEGSDEEYSRQSNWRGAFGKAIAIANSHRLVLRSKQVTPTPKVGIGEPPALPKGERPHAAGRKQAAWDRQAGRFAAFYLVAFKPWSCEQPLQDLSWDAFLSFWEELHADASVLARNRIAVIQNMASFNQTTNLKKRLLTKRRSRDATVWSHDYGLDACCQGLHDRSKDGKGPKRPYVGGCGVKSSPEVACEDVVDLLAKQKLDHLVEADSRAASYERALIDYNNNTLQGLSRVFDVGESAAPVQPCGSYSPPIIGNTVGDPVEAIMKIRQMKPCDASMPAEARLPANLRVDAEKNDAASSSRRQYVGVAGRAELFFNGKYTDKCEYPRLPESLGVDDLQPTGQRQVFDVVMTYIRRCNRFKHGLRSTSVPVPRLLVHGPAGTGKTYTVCKLMVAAKYYGYKVLPVALQGSAASNMPGGVNIHHLIKAGVDDDGSEAFGITMLAEEEIVELLDGVAVIVIDEISMVPARLLYRLHQKLCTVLRKKEPFGGLAVVALGDMYQIKPVRAPPLFSMVIDRALGRVRQKNVLPQADLNGIDLFLDMMRMELTTDMRAVDKRHAALVGSMREIAGLSLKDGEGPMTEEIAQYMANRVLSYDDVGKDPSWSDAPIIVTSNRERGVITLAQARRWGKRHGVPVIRWYYGFNLSIPEQKEDAEIRAFIYTNEASASGLFVEGAVAYLTQNINPRVGLSNGTRCFFHSLSFDPSESPDKVNEALAKIKAAGPGDIVDIGIRPISVNVRLEGEAPRERAKRLQT